MQYNFDYEGKLASVVKTADSRIFTCEDGVYFELTVEEYKEAVDFAGFAPRKGTMVRGFTMTKSGEVCAYSFRFVR